MNKYFDSLVILMVTIIVWLCWTLETMPNGHGESGTRSKILCANKNSISWDYISSISSKLFIGRKNAVRSKPLLMIIRNILTFGRFQYYEAAQPLEDNNQRICTSQSDPSHSSLLTCKCSITKHPAINCCHLH